MEDDDQLEMHYPTEQSPPAPPSVSLVDLYKRYCADEKCHVNSAVVKYMEARDHQYSLDRLSLRFNYLGPKGLRPVLKLIEYCQTITEIDLEGNGADNDFVEKLSELLKHHLSITSLNLRDNPISSTGGKALLELVETNSRITTIDVSDTDIFKALQDRIVAAAEANRYRRDGSHNPQIVAAKGDAQRTAPSATGAAGNKTLSPSPPPRPKKALLETLGGGGEEGSARGGAAATGTAADRSALPEIGGAKKHPGQQPHITKIQAKPPIPAYASRNSTRLSEDQLKAIRQKYAERARLFNELNNSDASRTVNQTRRELMALEHPALATAGTATAASTTGSASGTSSPKLPSVSKRAGGAAPADADAAAAPGKLWATTDDATDAAALAKVRPNTVAVYPTEDKAGGDDGDAQRRPPRVTDVAATAPAELGDEDDHSDHGGSAMPMPGSAPQPNTVVSETLVNRGTGVSQGQLDPSRMAILSREEQFQILFDQGCKAYAQKDLDAAYLAWNEAMRIAVDKKNREWMAVVSSNLQRLSYELLVEEGVTHLNHGELEEADRSFELALEVAKKARNAAWESEMQRARKNVQNAVFHRCHEAALVIFDRAQQSPEQIVSEDDFYVVPGTDVMVQHTQAFVTEWSCLLLVQEAVHMWAEASQVADRVGGTSATILHDVIDQALLTVSCFLTKRFFDAQEPDALSWQGTSRYHFHECVLLSELWADMSSVAEERLHHYLFVAVASAQLGHLYLATHQLSLSEQQFERVMTYGQKLQDTLLEATGLTFSGILNWQRAHYAVAERQLQDGIYRWERLLADESSDGTSGVVGDQTSTLTTSGEAKSGQSGAAADGAASGVSQLQKSLPESYISNMIDTSNKYRVSIMAATYRYREALEALEFGLNHQYRDILYRKMKANFVSQPTLDQLAGISTQIQSPLIYYFTNKRYEWDDAQSIFLAVESIFIWVVTPTSEMRFVELNVTKEFKTSIDELLRLTARGLRLQPLDDQGAEPEIITTLHGKAWMSPLRLLYRIFLTPIVDFIANSCDRGNETILTIIPSGHLWLVPYNALISDRVPPTDGDARYLVEDVALQLAFSATQCAFCSLSTEQVRRRDVHRDVVAVQPDIDPASSAAAHLLYPLDSLRSISEGEAVANVMRSAKTKQATEIATQTTSGSATGDAVFVNQEVIVDSIEELRRVAPSIRTLHVAAACTYGQKNEDGSHGALCLASENSDMELLRSSEVAHTQLYAEMVALSNTNMSLSRTAGVCDDVLTIIRSLFSSGVPCVVAGQWCTPDMKPEELFTLFYKYQREATTQASTRATASARQQQQKQQQQQQQRSRVGASTEGVGGAGAGTYRLVTAREAEPEYHKALSLARAIRTMLENDDLRFAPRQWAGYYCVGYGYF